MHLVQLLYDTHSKHVDKHLTQLSFPALKKPLLHFLQFPLSQSSQFGLHVLFGSILLDTESDSVSESLSEGTVISEKKSGVVPVSSIALNFINEVSFILYLFVILYIFSLCLHLIFFPIYNSFFRF